MTTQLKELDPKKIEVYGRLTDIGDNLDTIVFINRRKTRIIFDKFKTRR